jgi:N6-L-threonylcarbamoyladenine synthase
MARGQHAGLPVFVPSLALSTDNAAMIAAAGLREYRAGVTAGWELNADASLRI